MKRFLLIGLASLLIMSSLGHVFAAAFCPRALGRECCFANTSSHGHTSPSTHEDMAMHGMPMEGMTMDDMAMDNMATDETAMEDTARVDVSTPFSLGVVDNEAVANEFEQPIEACSHCLSHSGPLNAPASFVSVPDQSGRDVGSVPLPVLKFPVRPAMTLSQSGLPREHAPPGSSAPRHILISVFLI
jgi:hypothetical protein